MGIFIPLLIPPHSEVFARLCPWSNCLRMDGSLRQRLAVFPEIFDVVWYCIVWLRYWHLGIFACIFVRSCVAWVVYCLQFCWLIIFTKFLCVVEIRKQTICLDRVCVGQFHVARCALLFFGVLCVCANVILFGTSSYKIVTVSLLMFIPIVHLPMLFVLFVVWAICPL